jgi:hypothetical protein
VLVCGIELWLVDMGRERVDLGKVVEIVLSGDMTLGS